MAGSESEIMVEEGVRSRDDALHMSMVKIVKVSKCARLRFEDGQTTDEINEKNLEHIKGNSYLVVGGKHECDHAIATIVGTIRKTPDTVSVRVPVKHWQRREEELHKADVRSWLSALASVKSEHPFVCKGEGRVRTSVDTHPLLCKWHNEDDKLFIYSLQPCGVRDDKVEWVRRCDEVTEAGFVDLDKGTTCKTTEVDWDDGEYVHVLHMLAMAKEAKAKNKEMVEKMMFLLDLVWGGMKYSVSLKNMSKEDKENVDALHNMYTADKTREQVKSADVRECRSLVERRMGSSEEMSKLLSDGIESWNDAQYMAADIGKYIDGYKCKAKLLCQFVIWWEECRQDMPKFKNKLTTYIRTCFDNLLEDEKFTKRIHTMFCFSLPGNELILDWRQLILCSPFRIKASKKPLKTKGKKTQQGGDEQEGEEDNQSEEHALDEEQNEENALDEEQNEENALDEINQMMKEGEGEEEYQRNNKRRSTDVNEQGANKKHKSSHEEGACAVQEIPKLDDQQVI